MKPATVALVVSLQGQESDLGESTLVEILSDDREIALLEACLNSGESEPLRIVHHHRQKQLKEDDEFGNYVEELLSQPFIPFEIREHGVQWLKSKIRIEKFQKNEAEAAKVIADYAYRLYRENPLRTDFTLAGRVSEVRVRVFKLPENKAA